MSYHPGVLEYRCRRCAVVETSTHTPDVSTTVISLITDTWCPFGAVSMLGLHSCADGGTGITDAIGGKPDQ